METIHTHIRNDLNELHSKINPDFEGDLTHQFVRATLVLLRRLKTRLEILDAQYENDQV